MDEIWKDITGYEGYYQVSNLGNVRSLTRFVNVNNMGDKALRHGQILSTSLQNSGYLYVTLNKFNTRKNFLVHRLVAEAFIPNPDNLEQVNHKDENKINNNLNNLEWCTRKYNCNYGTSRERISLAAKKREPNPKAIEKMRQANLGSKRSEDFCKKISERMRGHVKSEETKRKLSESLKGKYTGENAPFFGRKHTEETKRKLSESKKGKQKGEKNPMYGKRHTEEAKKRMGEKKKKKVIQYSISGELIKIWNSPTDAARELKLNLCAICNCCSGRLKTSGGFVWKYFNDVTI